MREIVYNRATEFFRKTFIMLLIIFASNYQILGQKFSQLIKGNVQQFGVVPAINGQYYFAVSGQVWKTDGTAQNTQIVRNLGITQPNQVESGASPKLLIPYQNKLIFTAETKESGKEYWVTDGSEAGTKLIKDIETGQNSGALSTQKSIIVFKDKLFFLGAGSKENGFSHNLWISDATEQGTSLFREFGDDKTTYFINNLIPLNNDKFLKTQ